MKTQAVRSDVMDTGQVTYTVADVGTFTLGYHPGRHPEEDPQHLLVVFGDAVSTDVYQDRAQPTPKSPKYFGVQLVGHCIVDVDDVLDYLSRPPERRSSWWLAARRWTADGSLADVPAGTRRQAAHSVASLGEDFLDRPDAADLLHAHRCHHAPARGAAAHDRLSGIEEEIAAWTILAQRESQLVSQHQAWAVGSGDEPALQQAEFDRPRGWRPPLTHAGAHYLARAFPQPR